MTVSTFLQTNAATQPVNAYVSAIDGDISVMTRLGATFAPSAQAPNMTILLQPGHIFDGTNLIEVAAQSTATFMAPVSNPRIDRVVVQQLTGVVSVVTGTESTSPTPPSIPSSTVPVAQVLLQPSTTAITNAMITDERDLNRLGAGSGAGTGLLNVQVFTANGTYTPTPGTNKIIVEVQGGGGAGGSCTSTATLGSACTGGDAGAYAKGIFTTGFAGAAVTVGAGSASSGPGAITGQTGGTSSFGTVITAPGGLGGIGGIGTVAPFSVGPIGIGSPATGGNIVNSLGQQGSPGLIMSTACVLGGGGGASVFGGGAGTIPTPPGTGSNAISPGSGGGGACTPPGGAARAGGAGANGIVIVHEYA